MKRLGRIMLWFVIWPVGLWRSLRHGSRKDMKRLEKRLAERQGTARW